MNRTLHFRVEVNEEDVVVVFESLENLKRCLEESIKEELGCNDIWNTVVGRIEKP